MIKTSFYRFLAKLALIVPGGASLRPLLHRIRGTKVGKGVWISQFVYMDELHPESIEIGENCTIGMRTSIINHLYWGPRRKDNQSHVVIEDDVFIGPHCVILPNVRIGKGTVIQAGTVVNKNVPPGTLWGSQPAGPLARATVPLTPQHEFEEFVAGLRPARKEKRKDVDR